MTKGTTTLQFKYNDAGLRTQKTNGSTTTKYYWAGSNITHMTSGSDTLHFWYDATGLPSMVTYNGAKYYYKLNQQGDVIGLLDTTGKQVVTLTYDSWGKILTRTGEMAETLGLINPLRYRGYIYDLETGLYYLQSRYYNPEWGRFINADSAIYCDDGIITANMFAYCNNNSVNYTDYSGNIFMHAGVDGAFPDPEDIFLGPAKDFGSGRGRGDKGGNQGPRSNDKKGSKDRGPHDSDTSPHNREKHERGDATRARNQGGERGDDKRSIDIDEGTRIAAGCVYIVVGVAGLIVLVGDDVTGVGTLDDPLIVPVGEIVKDGITMVTGGMPLLVPG